MTKRPNSIRPMYIPGIKIISEITCPGGKLKNPSRTGYTIATGKIMPLKRIQEPTPINPSMLTSHDL